MRILRAESLKAHNSLALQASASAMVLVSTPSELTQALDWSRSQGLPVLPLGQGSNVVFAGDVEALILRQQRADVQILSEKDQEVALRVAAGTDWHSLVSKTLEQRLYGLENLALIPGTVGAAPIQNIGAYGIELAPFVLAVHAIEIASGKRLELSRDECAFGYRDSVFKQELRDEVIITAVDLRLRKSSEPNVSYPALRAELESAGVTKPTPEDVFTAVVKVRSKRLPDPAQEPNAGSFFKNPVLARGQVDTLLAEYSQMPVFVLPDERVKVPAAWLIDQAGWKGQRQDGVGVHSGHALVLVNHGSDSGKALLKLAADIVASVKQRFDISLEIEPRIYGAVA